MKKKVLALAVLAVTGASAQTTITFDDLTIPADTFYNGSDLAGEFVSGGLTFTNDYNDQFDYWSGWSYSNMTDVVTQGAENQYSAFPGSGGDGSDNYAVNYSGYLHLGVPRLLESVQITNTTWTALSMQNGDQFGKVFGSPNNANGDPDGTNGEDYFRLLIIGCDADTNAIDTVTFYLADYRFANNDDDYIVDTWETVDLSELGEVTYLNFKLESSDVSFGYINTPGYFALDNLKFGTVGLTEHTIPAFQLYPNPANDHITIDGQAGSVRIYNATGSLIWNGASDGLLTLSTDNWNAGCYFVELTNATGVTRSTLIKR